MSFVCRISLLTGVQLLKNRGKFCTKTAVDTTVDIEA